MATKRHKPEEIVSKLRQVDVLVGQGQARIDAIRQVQITEQTYYRWRKQYGGMGNRKGECLSGTRLGSTQHPLYFLRTHSRARAMGLVAMTGSNRRINNILEI